MIVRSLSSFHIQRAGHAIERKHFAKRPVILTSQLVALTQLDFLGRILVSVNRAASGLPFLAEKRFHLADVLESGNGLRLVEEILFRQLSQPEELPPLCLLLSMMPINEIRE